MYDVKNDEIRATAIIVEQSLSTNSDFPFVEKESQIHTDEWNIIIKDSTNMMRVIRIASYKPIRADALYLEFSYLEKLLMLFDGCFLEIRNIHFETGESADASLEFLSEEYAKKRLKFYETNKVFCQEGKLLDWKEFLTNSIYSKWKLLLKELDITHQIFLYCTANDGVPMELKLPFLIECAEPLIELITIETGRFSSLSPGNRGTSLKMCLDAIISSYGMDIFSGEYAEPVEFTQRLVNTRVRIMHIKRNSEKDVIAGIDIHLYAIKMSLLYRRVLLDLLGVDYRSYSQKLKRIVTVWEKHIEEQKIFSIEKS
jgi:hypothetical protein